MSESKASVGYLEADLLRQFFKLEHVSEARRQSESGGGFLATLLGKKKQGRKGAATVWPSRYLIAAALVFERVCFPDERASVSRFMVSMSGVYRVPYQVPGLDVLGFCPLEVSDFMVEIDRYTALSLLSEHPQNARDGAEAGTLRARCAELLRGSADRDPDFLDICYWGGTGPNDFEKAKQVMKNVNSAGDCIEAAMRDGAVPLLRDGDALQPVLLDLFPSAAMLLKVYQVVVRRMGRVRLGGEALAALRNTPEMRELRSFLAAAKPDADCERLGEAFLSQLWRAVENSTDTGRELAIDPESPQAWPNAFVSIFSHLPGPNPDRPGRGASEDQLLLVLRTTSDNQQICFAYPEGYFQAF